MNSRCQSLSFVQQIRFEDSKAKRNEPRSTHHPNGNLGYSLPILKLIPVPSWPYRRQDFVRTEFSVRVA